MKDVYDNTLASRSLDSDVRTTSATGEAVVDTKGYDNAKLIAIAGDITATTGDTGYTVTVFESDSSTTGFATTGISVTFGNGESNTVKQASIPSLNLQRKRFLRLDLSGSATTFSFEGGAVIDLGQPHRGGVN